MVVLLLLAVLLPLPLVLPLLLVLLLLLLLTSAPRADIGGLMGMLGGMSRGRSKDP